MPSVKLFMFIKEKLYKSNQLVNINHAYNIRQNCAAGALPTLDKLIFQKIINRMLSRSCLTTNKLDLVFAHISNTCTRVQVHVFQNFIFTQLHKMRIPGTKYTKYAWTTFCSNLFFARGNMVFGYYFKHCLIGPAGKKRGANHTSRFGF